MGAGRADRTLVGGGRAVRTGPGWLARLFAGPGHALVDRIDAGLATGSIDATLPDGTRRLLGGRAPGFGATVSLNDWRGLLRVATAGSVGLYQGWERGEWESPDPVPLFALFMANARTMGSLARAQGPWRRLLRRVHVKRRNTKAGAVRNIHAHYDLGNEFYAAWLGPTMLYSSALFPDADEEPAPSHAAQFFSELDNAQNRKVAALDERLALDEGAAVLEIGCGWGTLAAFLADKYAARVDAISLSDAQLAWARERWSKVQAGRLDFRKQDYRDVAGQYDAVVSAEMVEALGREYWPAFMDCLARNLKPGGRAALQLIVIAPELFADYAASADFIQTYVFPGGMLIEEGEFAALAKARGLSWEDRRAFGHDYARTLRLWRAAFLTAWEQGRLPAGFDASFVRLWTYYLMYCEGGFLGGGIDVVQVTLRKETV